MTRRKFIYITAIISAGITLACNSKNKKIIKFTESFYLPSESDTHKCTWLYFVSPSNLTKEQSDEIKRNLVSIITIIAKYEALSILVGTEDKKTLMALLGDINSHHYPIEIFSSSLNHLDTHHSEVVFVKDKKGQKVGIDFSLDKQSPFLLKQKNKTKNIKANIVLKREDFSIDGEGTAIVSESSLINEAYNPNWDKEEIEAELKQLLGLKKILWLKNVDKLSSYVRFVRQGVVVVSRDDYKHSSDYALTREIISRIKSFKDAKQNTLEIHIITMPNFINDSYGFKNFASSYLGYYVCNNALIIQKFGDKISDNKAKETLKKLFPNKTIEELTLDGLASIGESIYSTTLQEFKA